MPCSAILYSALLFSAALDLELANSPPPPLETIDNVGFDAELAKPWSVLGEGGDAAGLANEATLRITVTGMTCASCSGTVTRAIEGLEGGFDSSVLLSSALLSSALLSSALFCSRQG